MTALTKYIALVKRARELSDEATPGEYELRCKEFSNVAALEIWTDLGWLKELPFSYRQPTYEMIVENRTLVPQLCDAVERLTKALEECRVILLQECSGHAGYCDCQQYLALAKLEAILKGEK